jgi:hypothetical protein
VHQRLDEEVWAADDEVREDLRAAIEVIEILPLVWGMGGRFSRLALADRDVAFRRMTTATFGPVVRAASALKQLCARFYYASDAIWPVIGYRDRGAPVPPPSALAYAELVRAAR